MDRRFSLIFVVSSCFLVAGCGLIMAERIWYKSVSLTLPARAPGVGTTVVTNAEVQEALRIIDSTLVANGFARSPNQPGSIPNEAGWVASYEHRADVYVR